jgi:hypothetical protein
MPHSWWMDEENVVLNTIEFYSAIKNEILSFAS